MKPNEYNELCLSYKKVYKRPEEWRIVVYNGITTPYAVSNYGRIFNLDKMKVPTIKHYTIDMKLDTGNYKRIGIYRLVALMFIPIPQKYIDAGYTSDGLIVDHIRDGEKDSHSDNTVWNLQWLTNFENFYKYNKNVNNVIRKPFTDEFRNDLDKMILDGYDNKSIYKAINEKYGYEKSDIKATLQVRRRRLGATLKEHHEYDTEYVQKIDELMKKGYSNKEIMKEFELPGASESSYMRLLKYRRKVLNIPAKVSTYLDNEQNQLLNDYILQGYKATEILNKMIDECNLKLSDEDKSKFKSTIASRISLYKRKNKDNISSTTIESIS